MKGGLPTPLESQRTPLVFSGGAEQRRGNVHGRDAPFSFPPFLVVVRALLLLLLILLLLLLLLLQQQLLLLLLLLRGSATGFGRVEGAQ